MLILITIFFTWIGYHFTVLYIDKLTAGFFAHPPLTETIIGWLKYAAWYVGKFLFIIISRLAAFYLSFLLAYTLTTPGYTFLSTATEKINNNTGQDIDPTFSLSGILTDVIEGVKISLLGIVVTIIALLLNFVPGFGQLAVILLYTFYSTLMFIDFPASRRRWTLGKKLHWLAQNSSKSLRIGYLPALLSLIPFVNIFAMALFFPILTIHSTLNFLVIERSQHQSTLFE